MIEPFLYLLLSDDENEDITICKGYDIDNFKLPENETYNAATKIYLEFVSDNEQHGNGFRVHIRQGNFMHL